MKLPVVWLALGAMAASAQETNRVDPRSFDAFKLVFERNIFNPNRQPIRQFVPREAPPPVDSFSLAGTMSYAKGMFAVFDGNKPDYHAVLEPGGRIAGYTVDEITHEFVKLSAGTNLVELRVGMHMQRSEDGKWSPTERSGETYGLNSHRRTSNRYERTDRTGRFGRNSFRSIAGAGFSSTAVSTAGGATAVEPAAGDAPDAGPPPDMNPNDPVARLMMRRLQEEGGNAGQNDANGPGDQPAGENNPDRNPGGTGPNETDNPRGASPQPR